MPANILAPNGAKPFADTELTFTSSFRDGVQKTGLCCAAMFIIDRMQTDQRVDIFHAVRRVQASRPQFMQDQVSSVNP